MSIYHKVEQRSAAWYWLRIGKPTASEFSRIVTPTGKLSAQSSDYARLILSEMMLGKVQEMPETEWMVRGQQLEDNAIEAYEFNSGLETSLGGFVTTDDGRVGCSPDRLVGDDGIIEMKCPAPNTMIGYLLDRNSLEIGKKPQVQGELLVTGRKWCDLVAYHPEMPIVIVRVKRDEVYLATLQAALTEFIRDLDRMREVLEGVYGKFPEIRIPEEQHAAAVGEEL